MSELWEKFSSERKSLQAAGELPPFMETAGYSMFIKKYVEVGQTVKQRYEKIAAHAGKIAEELYGEPESGETWEEKFFEAIWKGWLSPSTPVLANLGTERGMAVSCESSYIEDSVYGFYDSLKEAAVLTQQGFGTSAYLGDIRPRGSKFSDNGKANGIVPIIKNFVEMTNQVSQGSTRRGSWAGYVEIEHDDFDELSDHILREPGNLNIGWIFTDEFIGKLKSGDKEAIRRYQKVLKIRAILGKGYIWKVDAVNRQNPEAYRRNGLLNKSSNLCSEIALFSDADHSYTCVLSSVNISKYDEWKGTDLIFVGTVFLDCIAEDFKRRGSKVRGLEKAIRYTEKARSLGLGVMGYHEYLQVNTIPFESDEAREFNKRFFSEMRSECERASRWMADKAGSPEWCEGTGFRNTHFMAVAPTMSTALIVGGTSQGIEPFVANVWNQSTAAGEVARINPALLDLMKEYGVYNQKTIDDIIADQGSVQNQDWLSDEEKKVFITAYEINQEEIIQQASDRQQFIDQGQSLNLFFDANESPARISKIHSKALIDPYIKGLYYLRSRAGLQASQKR